MNQPNAPAMLTRTAAASNDAPDILHVLRRFTLLMIIGTVIGAVIGLTLYTYFRKRMPLYRAQWQFQVLDPPQPLGSSDISTPPVRSPDDVSQFIHRQVRYIMNDRILTKILQTKEFTSDYHFPDDTTRRSQWLTENQKNPLKELRKDLSVTPLVDSAAFEISMTAHDPYESFTLVNAVKTVYLQDLQQHNNDESQARLANMDNIRKRQEDQVQRLSEGANQYRENKNVPALTSRQAFELQNLQLINSDQVRIASQLASAQETMEGYAAQEKNREELVVSPEMEEYIKNDSEMRSLDFNKLQLIQDLKVLQGTVAPTSTQIAAVQIRMDVIDKQMAKLRQDLIQESFKRLKDRAQQEVDGLKAQLDYITGLEKGKEKDVQLLDTELVEYQQKVDELKAGQNVLDKLRLQDTLMILGSNTDDTRVQPYVSAQAPDAEDFVWPSIYVFLPAGTAIGFGISFLLSYLLVLTDTRVRTPRDITRTLQLPLLGFIPDESDDRSLTCDVATALVDSPSSMIAESFRQIRSHLCAQTENSPVNTLLVASIAPGGGATTVASNLASGMALNGRRVLLIDANFYRPALAKLYKNVPTLGFSDLLDDPSLMHTAIVPSSDLPKLHLLGAGSQMARASSEMLEGRGFRDLLEQLKSQYDLIIFDGAPLNLVADSITLAARVDGVVSVIRAGEVSRGTVGRIREQLRQVHANLLGFILNAAQTSSTGYFKENYRTFYRYAGQGRRPSAPAGSRE